MNLEIRKFEEDMVSLYNSSNAPAEAKILVLLEILHKAEIASQNALQIELSKIKESEVANSEQSV